MMVAEAKHGLVMDMGAWVASGRSASRRLRSSSCHVRRPCINLFPKRFTPFLLGVAFGQATSCAFEDNYSPFDGGAVFANGGSSTVTLVDSRFERNIAEYSGGAVLVDSASFLYALETIFVENSARDSSYGGGGAISCLGGSPQVSLHGCEFEGNNASMRGGAVYVDAQGGDLLLSSTRFERNWGRYGGGAVCASRTGTVSCRCQVEVRSRPEKWFSGVILVTNTARKFVCLTRLG